MTVNREFGSLKAFVKEYIDNLSESGAFIRTHEPLPIGTPIKLRFSVVLDDIETLEGYGIVTRVSKKPRGMGVAFTELTRTSQELLQRLVTRAGQAIPLTEKRGKR